MAKKSISEILIYAGREDERIPFTSDDAREGAHEWSSSFSSSSSPSFPYPKKSDNKRVEWNYFEERQTNKRD